MQSGKQATPRLGINQKGQVPNAGTWHKHPSRTEGIPLPEQEICRQRDSTEILFFVRRNKQTNKKKSINCSEIKFNEKCLWYKKHPTPVKNLTDNGNSQSIYFNKPSLFTASILSVIYTIFSPGHVYQIVYHDSQRKIKG